MANRRKIYRRLALAVALDSVLFPFDLSEFLQLLPAHGYVLVDEVRDILLAGPGRISAEGIVARRGDIAVNVHTDRMTIGVLAPELDLLNKELQAIESVVTDELGVPLQPITKFGELIADATVASRRPPVESWAQHRSAFPLVADVGQIMGADLAPFGFRLTSSETLPIDREWIDLQVTPFVNSASNRHHVNLVYRHPDPSKVSAFAQRFDGMIDQILDRVEGVGT